MEPRLQQLPFYHLLTPAEQQELVENSETALLLDQWEDIERHVRSSISQVVTDRHLLVLYALSTEYPEDLTSEELERVRSHEVEIQQMVDAFPVLTLVLDRIRQDRVEFESSWNESFRSPARILPFVTSQYRWVAAVAAVVMIAVVVMLQSPFFTNTSSTQVIAAENGQVKHRFDDGSTVLLDEGAELSYAESKQFGRKVHLSGAAFFDVSHDPDHPFEVETDHAVTRVLGTQFGVRSGLTETEVVLATGKVEVRSLHDPESSVVLAPGQKSRIPVNSAPETPTIANLSETLSWSGYLFLGGMTMAEAVELVSEEYGISVQISEELTSVRLSSGAVFEHSSFPEAASLLEVLAGTVGASLETVGTDRYTMQ